MGVADQPITSSTHLVSKVVPFICIMDVGKLGKILVRSVAREDSLSLTLVLKGKLHRLLRPKEESLGKTLRRISLTANKTEKSSAKVRKKNTEPTASEVPCPIEACLYCGESEVSSQVPNSRAWVDGNVLVISDAKFAVTVNPPAATSLRVPDCAMSGYPIIPQVECWLTQLDEASLLGRIDLGWLQFIQTQ